MSEPARLGVAEFERLRQLFNGEAGLQFDDSAIGVFERRLAGRLPARDLSNFRDYVHFLSSGHHAAEERGIALDLITTGETYFFRHEEQLDVLRDTILPRVCQEHSSSRRLTIWSAGCSTGEEAYTAAILALESHLFSGWTIRVFGTDLSAERIEHAQQGCYFRGAFRSTPTHLLEKHFEARGRFWQVGAAARELCHFTTANLLSRNLSAIVGRVNVVLCRNVLLYLNDDARARVVKNLHERLVPGGYLLLGHSESLRFLRTPAELFSSEGDLAYRRSGLATRPRGVR